MWPYFLRIVRRSAVQRVFDVTLGGKDAGDTKVKSDNQNIAAKEKGASAPGRIEVP